MKTIPQTKPQNLTQALFDERVSKYGIDRVKHPIVILGLRDYYDDAVGGAQFDRNFYDDAFALSIHHKDGRKQFLVFNGNTDPSIYRKPTAKQKGIASLVEGIYYAHKLDFHKGKYLALCQLAGMVKVLRDGGLTETGHFGINIHSGGLNGTWSLGCQTFTPSQFIEFMGAILAYFGLDVTKIFKDYFKPTQAEIKAFTEYLIKNRLVAGFTFCYVLDRFK